MSCGRGRRLLLGSSSVVALLIGGAPAALAVCAITPTANQASISNSANINCVYINGIAITNGVTNASTGVIAGTGAAFPTQNGITIRNATVGGAVVNAGTITTGTSGKGIFIFDNAVVSGGISNSGGISADHTGVLVEGVSTFGGGISNAGSISGINDGINIGAVVSFGGGISNSGTIAGQDFFGIEVGGVSVFSGDIGNSGKVSAGDSGISIQDVTIFSGGISNSGTISAAADDGIFVGNGSTFAGSIGNGGTISAVRLGISVSNIAQFGATAGGGITNGGTISAGIVGIFIDTVSTFMGGVTSNGKISAGAEGIAVNDLSSFAGGIRNAGAISAGLTGLSVATVSNFEGGISNSGTISAGNYGIVAVNDSNFTGSIDNRGVLQAGTDGIRVIDVSTFAGGIGNSGTISASSMGVWVSNVAQFGNGDAGGGISNAGTISVYTNGIRVADVSTFAGTIGNSGTIAAADTGVLVSGGTLFGSTSGAGITNSGTIAAGIDGIDLFNVSTFAGGIDNSGTITAKSGIGIIVLGTPTLSGGISNSGTINGFTGLEVASSGSVRIFDAGTIIGTGGTAVDLSGNAPGNTFTLGPGYDIAGKVLGQSGDTLQLGGTGSGSFDLSQIGPTQQYEGFDTFNVVSGMWTATGAFSGTQAWNVNGGTLAGTGTFVGINVHSGGTLEPGTPGKPGTIMTLNGNLAFGPGAEYLVNISPTVASRANVEGAVTLAGAVEGYLSPGSYSAKTTYDILDPSTIGGTFTGFSAINAPGFSGTLTYDSTEVLLNLTAQLGLTGGLNTNQQNVASAINTYFNSGGSLPASFFPVFGLSGPALGKELTQLDGEDATGAEHSALDLMDSFLELMLGPFASGRTEANDHGALGFAPDQRADLPPDVARAYSDVFRSPPAASFQQRWTTWAAAFGGGGTTNGDPIIGSNNITTSTYGYAAGMDYHVSPDTVFGFSLAGGGTNWNLANTLGDGRSDAFLVGVYGVTHDGPWYLGGTVAFADNWFTTNRSALGDQLSANFQGQDYAVRLEGGYRFALAISRGAVGVTPYAALQTHDFQTPAYRETDLTGGGFGLSYNAMNGTDTRTELGARFDDLTALSTMPLVLRARLAWAHDWVSNPALNASFEALPSSSFTVFGASIPHDSGLTSAGAQLFLTPNWSLLAKFDSQFSNGYHLYTGSGMLRYTW